MSELYIAADGDNVGNRLEYFMLLNKCEALAEFSTTFRTAMGWLEDRLVYDFGATVVFRGGDNLLAIVHTDDLLIEDCEALRVGFAERSHCTLSIGLGAGPRQAYFALKLAKASGKDSIRQYKEFPDG